LNKNDATMNKVPTIYRYRVVDVFSRTTLEGNPAAVFPEAEGLDDRTMLAIARELNLSETVFILPSKLSDCVAKFRIFTPTVEMLFAGHPTLGAASVLIEERSQQMGNSFSVELPVGPVPIRIEQETSLLWLTTPSVQTGDTYDRRLAALSVNLVVEDLLPDCTPQLLSAGNANIYIPVRNTATVDRATPNYLVQQTLNRHGTPPGLHLCICTHRNGCLFTNVRSRTWYYRRPGNRQCGRAPGSLFDAK
jgi:trans-2,3-dihydro-3-hydroxyanthranilate isomerase